MPWSSNRDLDDRKTTNQTPITPPPSKHLPKRRLSIHKWIRSIDESSYCHYTTPYSSSSRNEKITTRSTYIQKIDLSYFLPYMVIHRNDWSEKSKVKVLSRGLLISMRCLERGWKTMMTFGTPSHEMLLQSVVQRRHHTKFQMKQLGLSILFMDQGIKFTHCLLQIRPHLSDLHTSLVFVHRFFSNHSQPWFK